VKAGNRSNIEVTDNQLTMKKKNQTKAEQIFEDYTDRSSMLDTREKEVIEKYYGFGENMKHTLDEIGKSLGITRERTRQIKFYAVSKISAK